MSKWKFNHPKGAESCLGEMSFIKEDGSVYKIGGQTFKDFREVVDEYNLLMEVQNCGVSWMNPVTERINIRANALKQNLMDLHKESNNGAIIRKPEDTETADTSGGRGPSDDDRPWGRAEAKKTPGKK